MKLPDDIGNLAATLGAMAAELKDAQHKLSSYTTGRGWIDSDPVADSAPVRESLEPSAAERITRLNAANDELRGQAAELTRRNLEITLFSKMNDFLQTSATEAEAYSVISETATQLFPEDSGAVYVLSASRDMLEAAAVWGLRPPANVIFPPDQCWAHRRGRIHLGIDHERWCSHVAHG